MKNKINILLTRPLTTLAFLHIAAANAFAGGGDMPWETPLETIMESISGPVAKAMGVIAIVVTGCGLSVRRRRRRHDSFITYL